MGSFVVLDYVVFLATVAISVSIGVFFAIWDRNKNTPSDYFFGGRNLSILPAALSFVVTFQSSLMILGSPADVYLYGMRYCYYCVGLFVAYTFAGIVIVPVLHRLQVWCTKGVKTVYCLLEQEKYVHKISCCSTSK